MARTHVAVRDAVPDDLPELVDLWGQMSAAAGRTERAVGVSPETAVLERLREVTQSPDRRLVVATVAGEVAGMAVLTHGGVLPMVDTTAIHVHYLHVRDGFRRRGVGHALLGAAASWAEERGADQVITALPANAREANRFFARLGFAQTVVRRVTSTTALRRRLALDPLHFCVDGAAARRRALRRVRAAMVRPVGR